MRPKKGGMIHEEAVHGPADRIPVAEICRKMGISDATFYNWRKKFAGMGVSEIRRLKALEDENRQLKRLVADLSLDKHMLQDVLSKKF
jgi:putative transposase